MGIEEKSKLYEIRLIVLMFLAWGFVFLDRTAVSYLMPVIMPELNLSNTEIGQINMWQTICYAITAPIIGMLSDKIGSRKKILIISVSLTAVFSGLSAFSNSYATLLIFRAIVGAAEGPILPLAMIMVASASGEGRFGRNTGLVNAGVSVIANMIGPILVTQLSSFTDWRWAFILVSIPTFIVATLLMKFTKEVPYKKQVDAESEQESGNSKNKFTDLLKYRNVAISIIVSIFCMGSLWIIYSFGPLFLTNVGGHSVEKMGVIMSSMGVFSMLWVVGVPFISDYLGRKPTLIIFSFIAMITPISLFIFPSGWVGVATLIILGGLIGALPTLFITIIPLETVPVHLIATASALIMGVGEIGGSLVLGIAGSIGDLYGLSSVILLAAIGPLLMALLGFGIIETLSKKPKDTSLTA